MTNDTNDACKDMTNYVYFKAGTKYFTTLKTTIDQYPESMIYMMINGSIPNRKVNGAIFIDMSPARFGLILDYMRTMVLPGMTKEQKENFENDLIYFQLPYHKPLFLSSQEKKLMEQVQEFISTIVTLPTETYCDQCSSSLCDKMYIYKWTLSESQNYPNADKVYSAYKSWAFKRYKRQMRDIDFFEMLRALGCETIDNKIYNFTKTVIKHCNIVAESIKKKQLEQDKISCIKLSI